ncbi:MAG: glycosyltransferase family 87 protein [Terriglobales bacterium]
MNPSKAERGSPESAAAYSRSPVPRILGPRVVYLLLGLFALLMVSDFVLRAIVPAFEPGKTDFSELYTSAWLWRHGENPYNSVLATATQERLVGVSVRLAPIYPPTTFALLSPFTFLPWGWANFTWLVLGFAGVAATIFLLWRLGGSRAWDLAMMALATFLLSFDPLHQAFHLGNVALLVVPLVLWAILLAEREKDWQAGLAIGVAACLKPQIGVWVLLYYLLRGRKEVFLGALPVGALVAAILLLRPAVLLNSIADYRTNLHYWFAPGRPYGFSEGALPFHVNIIQVILYRLLHSVFASNLIAHSLFVSGVAFWTLMLWRTNFRIPAPLAISSLLALSFLSLYHSVSDATILTLALCWAIPAEHQAWTRTKILTCVFFLMMMLPGHSLLMRLSPHIATYITAAWWWNLFVARYFVWLLVALNAVLLVGLWESAQSICEPGPDKEKPKFFHPARRFDHLSGVMLLG